MVEVTDEVETVPNAAPQFQSDGNYSVPENQAFVFDFNATDPDGDNLTYSILHGEDAHLLELIPSTGLLSFVSLPDFENPDDNNSDNRYEATVQVSDGNTISILNVVVEVTDEVETVRTRLRSFSPTATTVCRRTRPSFSTSMPLIPTEIILLIQSCTVRTHICWN